LVEGAQHRRDVDGDHAPALLQALGHRHLHHSPRSVAVGLGLLVDISHRQPHDVAGRCLDIVVQHVLARADAELRVDELSCELERRRRGLGAAQVVGLRYRAAQPEGGLADAVVQRALHLAPAGHITEAVIGVARVGEHLEDAHGGHPEVYRATAPLFLVEPYLLENYCLLVLTQSTSSIIPRQQRRLRCCCCCNFQM
jgi:hypothetical protein